MVETGKGEERRKDTLQYERSTTTGISSPNIGTTGWENTQPHHGEQILRPLYGYPIREQSVIEIMEKTMMAKGTGIKHTFNHDINRICDDIVSVQSSQRGDEGGSLCLPLSSISSDAGVSSSFILFPSYKNLGGIGVSVVQIAAWNALQKNKIGLPGLWGPSAHL
jgi:hypothetical protein